MFFSASPPLSFSVSRSVCLSVCLLVCLSVSLFQPVYLPPPPPSFLYVSLFLSLCQCLYLSVCLSVCLPPSPSLSPFPTNNRSSHQGLQQRNSINLQHCFRCITLLVLQRRKGIKGSPCGLRSITDYSILYSCVLVLCTTHSQCFVWKEQKEKKKNNIKNPTDQMSSQRLGFAH